MHPQPTAAGWHDLGQARTRDILRFALMALLAVAGPLLGIRASSAATFTVTTTSDTDDGTCNAAHCSLREAMTAAQAGGPHTIAFDIPGAGVRTILIGSNTLPTVVRDVTIDGYTQPGSIANTNATGAINAVPLIEIKPAGAMATGLQALSGTASLTVRGLVLSGFTTAQIAGTVATVRVEGCFLGTTPDGLAAAVTTDPGSGAAVNGGVLIVGGTSPAVRNVISGNNRGITGEHGPGTASILLVQGNLIGTNRTGTAAVPNSIGYIAAGANGGDASSRIGGETPAERNVISGNLFFGVVVGGNDSTVSNSFVKGNFIGTDVTGTQPLGNGRDGVVIGRGPDVFVGGTTPGEGNLIAFNGAVGVSPNTGRPGVGVLVAQNAAAAGIRVLGNRIFGNVGLGIDLQGNPGVTPNDAGDADVLLQNFPVITSVASSGGSTTIQGTLNSVAGRTYRLEFFSNDAAHSTSHGEGQTLLGVSSTTTNGSGNATFSVVLPVTVTSVQFVTATATDPDGNTSEFSSLEANVSVTHTDAPDPASLNQDVTHTLTVTNSAASVFPSGAVTLTYTQAAGATLVNNGGGTAAGSTVTFNLGVVPIGASVVRAVVVRYAAAGSKTSTATVTSVVSDPVLANNTAAATTTVVAAPPAVTISGTVRTGINTLLPGATLTLTGSATATTTSAANGTYSFPNLPSGGTYVVTPGLAGRVFEPVSRTLTAVTTNQTNVDFVGRLVFTISGQVRDLNDTGVPGVTMTLSGAQSATLTTDLDGRYAFAGLVAGGTYTVTPTKSTFAFNPPSQTFPNLAQDEVAEFFVAQVGTFTRYFAEGATGDFFDTRLALLNATGQPAVATVRFQRPAPQPEVTTVVNLTGLQRVTIDPKALGLTSAEFSTVIESTQPIIADRTMTWDPTGYGSHAETSVGRPLTQWFLAEGATINGFDLFYLIQNPNDAPANVEVRYLRGAPAPPIVKTYTVAPRSRFNIWVNTEDPALDDAELSASITVTNGVPVIVERAMYRPVGSQIFGAGHESMGVEAPALEWFFGEGATGPFFDLFFLIANPSAQASQLEARYLKPDGTVVTRTYDVPPNSRFNIWVDFEGPELADTAVSTTLRVLNNVPVVAERAMWWPGSSTTWHEGHNTAGATAVGEKWGLAEGEVGGPRSVETYILIGNTSAFGGTARVTLTFEDGTQATKDITLAANSRANVATSVEFPTAVGKRFGTVVESLGTTPAQIVVERAMYSNAGGVQWAAGTSALATRLR